MYSLIFTHSVESAHRLALLVSSFAKNNPNSSPIHLFPITSNLTLQEREVAISNLKKGTNGCCGLVCSDVLARGIVNYLFIYRIWVNQLM